MVSNLGNKGKWLKGFFGNPFQDNILDIAEVYEVGKLIGLSESDIDNIYHSDWRVKVKRFLYENKYRIISLVLIGIALYLIFYYIALPKLNAPTEPTSSYPRGTMYGVISNKDFRKLSS